MRSKVLKTIRQLSLFRSGDTVVVAVSGGADSVVLLDILASSTELRLNLVVAHLNHSLRGSESDSDEDFVCRLAAHYGCPCENGRSDVKALSRLKKISLEEAGRMARYAFLKEIAVKYRAQAIAVAHHADDQAETVLLRLLRGSGATGLAGMAPKTGGVIVRPLLRISRKEIVEYLQVHHLAYRNDSSNIDTTFLRNRIRHELMPCLATYNPSVRDRLLSTAEALAADEVLLEEMTDTAFARHGSTSEGTTMLSIPGVVSEATGLRLRLYRRAILLAKGNLDWIGSRHLHSIDRLVLSSRPNTTLNLPRQLCVVRTYGSISFTMSPEAPLPHLPEITIPGPGTYDFQQCGRLVIEGSSLPDAYVGLPRTITYFDGEAAPFPWVLRTFKAGDRFVPLGMTGHKKVKDLFIDEKIPLQSRGRFPLLFSRERLIWVCGLKASDETRITDQTRAVLKAEFLDFIA